MTENLWKSHRISRRAINGTIPALALAAILPATPALAASQSASTPTASPVTGNSDLDALLRPIVERKMDELLVPGAVILLRNQEQEYLHTFGTRIIGQNDPITIDDHFWIGSNTKTMTGTVLLQLVQEGLLSLDDPVSSFRDDIPNGENIKISQLMDMSSGLHSYTELKAFNQTMDDEPEKVWQPEELLAIGIAEPPYFAPGEGFHYSNTNTVLFALIAEQLTGKSIGDLMAERIFTPLGLTKTVFPAIEDASIPDPHPNGYMYGTNVSTLDTAVLSDADQKAARDGSLLPNDVTKVNPSWAWAAGAASSTAGELATYVEALVGGGLLDAAIQEERLASLKPSSDAPGAAEYGLAIAKFGPFIGHDGSLPGYQSFMGNDPDTGTTLIVLTNLQSSPEGLATANEIARPIIAGLYGSPPQIATPEASPFVK
ncbi:MAG: serine hydrolase domain-containing protein [Thermomicrobiales bacterium]